jgi:hypothetical protein
MIFKFIMSQVLLCTALAYIVSFTPIERLSGRKDVDETYMKSSYAISILRRKANDDIFVREDSSLFKTLEEMTLFDNTCKLNKKDDEKDIHLLKKLLPESIVVDCSDILKDMSNLVKIMRSRCDHFSDDYVLICRLQLLSGTRCPKWHEDYVQQRLIKTYKGPGTAICDPNNLFIRIRNYIGTTYFKKDPEPFSAVIEPTDVGDCLIIHGRHSTHNIPVLHRSPVLSDTYKRLLFTITLP